MDELSQLNKIFSLLIAFILMSALRPGVRALERKRIPRKLAVVLVYLAFIFVFMYLIWLVIPPIIIEVTALLKNLPYIVSDILQPMIGSWFQLDSITQYVPNVTSQAFEILGNVFSNIVFLLSTFFFGFYFLMEENLIKKFLTRFVGEDKAHEASLVFEKAEHRMSAWFWGEATLMFVVGLFTFIGLNLIGVRYALALAVLAGLLEVVPNLGPTISAIPAVLIGFSMSSVTGLATLALYFVVQQLENAFIVPWIMKRAVGLDPIITLMALIVGGKLGGVLGVLLAIPLLLFIGTFYFEIKKNKALLEDLI